MTEENPRRLRRDETPAERYDRNWNELLQELRVLQTGTQIITGFLLALAFQPAFHDLSEGQQVFYLCLVVLAAVSAVIALAPVALHRALFGEGAKGTTVAYGHVAMLSALLIVSVLLIGVVAFIFQVVVSTTAAWISAAALTVLVLALWAIAPWALRARHGRSSR